MSTYVLGENALRKLKAVFNATTIGVEDGPEARRLDDQDFVPAWTIKWASSLNSWIVWIPAASAFDYSEWRDISADARSGLAAAGGSYPSGWYKLSLSFGSTWSTVYLNVKDSSATISTSRITDAIWIPLARIKGTSNPFMRDVMQLQIGGIIIGGETSGYTGSVIGDCEIRYNSDDSHNIELWGRSFTYDHGLLKSVGDLELQSTIPTTPHVAHDGE